jgi:ribosomal RNA-processing protein 7
MVASSSSSAPLIKGYLPVRLSFPSQDGVGGGGGGEGMDETFFFVREHQGRSAAAAADGDSNSNTSTKSGSTLFVANAPVIPGVSTKILLSSIFGRFADVTRITAVQNPRAAAMAVAAANNNEDGMTAASPSSAFNWTDKEDMFQPTFLPPIFSSLEGKYAHVVFSSAKEMKKAKKELEDLMTTTTTNSGKKSGSRRRSKGRSKKGENDEDEGQQQDGTPRALIIDKLEIQSLSDESHRQRDEVLKNALKGDSDDDTDDDEYREAMVENTNNNNNKTRKYAGVLAVANRYRETSKLLRNRSKLMEECNVVMQAYEDAEEAKRKAQQVAKSEPDDDGFVTISYSGAVGSKIELEQSITATTPSRRKGNKRSRKKKEAMGSNELKDFYRFQRKDNRKRTMEDLRRQFEEDVRKVKRLKEEKEYRPF